MRLFRYIFPAAALLFSGCIKLDQTLTIRRDGSAIFEVTYALSEQAILQVKAAEKLEKEMAKVMEEESKDNEDDFLKMLFDPDEDRFRKKLKEYEKYGLTVERLRVEAKDAWRNVQVRLLVKDLGLFSKCDIFREYGFSLRKDEAGNYKLIRSGNPKVAESAPDYNDPKVVKQLEPILGDFKVLLRLNTPGKIVKSNASRTSAYRAEWIYEFSRDPAAVHRLHTEGQVVVFAGSGVNLPEIAKITASDEPVEKKKK